MTFPLHGDGPEKTALAEQINRLRVSDRVGLAGFLGDLRPGYAAAYFLVIPSRSESFPLVVLEAWAQGTPVVATPVGRLPELIDDGVNGLLAAEWLRPKRSPRLCAGLLTCTTSKHNAAPPGGIPTREKPSEQELVGAGRGPGEGKGGPGSGSPAAGR